MGKWFAGVSAAIIAGVVVYWATEGLRPIRPAPSPPPQTAPQPPHQPASKPPLEPPADFPGGSKRLYSASFNEWPTNLSEHGSITLESGDSYVLRPASNVTIGPGRLMDIPPLAGDFLLDVRFRVTERNPSATLSVELSGREEDADSLEAWLELWGEQSATYSLLKGRVRRAGLPIAHHVTEQSIADRASLPASIAAHRWSGGGKITLKREGGMMAFFVNDEFIRSFGVPLFAYNQIGLGASFRCTVVVTSIEARIKP